MLGFFFAFQAISFSQNISLTDSLETAYITRKCKKNEQLSILKKLS